MIGKLVSFVVYAASILVLSACGSLAAGDASTSGDGVPAATFAVMPTAVPMDSAGSLTPDSSRSTSPSQGVVTMRVLWRINSYVFPPDFTGDKESARAMLFKPLDIGDDAIIFDNQSCEGVTFEKQTANAAEYASSVWHVSAQALGLTAEQFQVVKTNCTLPGFGEYVRLNDGRLIVPIDGVFYIFEPVRN